MDLEAQKHVGLQVAPARLQQLTEYLPVTGTVQPADTRVSSIRPLARGRVQDVLVKAGDRVRKGQALVRFDNIEAGELTAQLEAARAELQRLKILAAVRSRETERARRLAEIGAAPRKDYEQSQAEQQALEESVRSQESVIAGIQARLRRFGTPQGDARSPVVTTVAAPFSGVVISATTAPGEVVDSGTELCRIADLTQVWVQAEVYEKDLGLIRVGQDAVISVDTYPGEAFRGRVTFISDVLDPQTRTAKVRCEVPNAEMRLKLDMFAAVQVPTRFRRRAIAVPVGAVQQVDGRNVLFIRKASTQFERREVVTGKQIGGLMEIASGVEPGEPVVVQGAFHLKSILAGAELGEE
jgi:cobalt-zinc-cadmium efflux system membrane fusion protein